MGVARRVKSLGLAHVAARVAYREILGVEAVCIYVEGGAIVVRVALVAAAARHVGSQYRGLPVFAYQTDVLVLGVPCSGVDVLVILARTDVYYAARTLAHGVDCGLHRCVVARAVLRHHFNLHGGVIIRSRVRRAAAEVAEVRQFAHIAHGIFSGILRLRRRYLLSEYLNLVQARRLALRVRTARAFMHSPAYGHVRGINDILHEISLVTE